MCYYRCVGVPTERNYNNMLLLHSEVEDKYLEKPNRYRKDKFGQ